MTQRKTLGCSSLKCQKAFGKLLKKLPQYGNVLQIIGQLFRQRSVIYSIDIRDAGAPLDSRVAFNDCTKIRICRRGGPNYNQLPVYSGHQRIYCLIYETIKTADGLLFFLEGLEIDRIHDLSFLRRSGWEDKFWNVLEINRWQFHIYGDSADVLRPWMNLRL